MQAGDKVNIAATVLRVDGNRVDAQTPDGQLIQTDAINVRETIQPPFAVAGGKFETDARDAVRGPRIPTAAGRRKAV